MPRKVPRWSRTWSQILSLASLTLVFGSMLNVFGYHLGRDMDPVSAWRAVAMLDCADELPAHGTLRQWTFERRQQGCEPSRTRS